MQQSDFDQQSFDLGMRCTCTTEANLPHDEQCQYRRVSEALRAAYRAGQIQMRERAMAVLRAGEAVQNLSIDAPWNRVVDELIEEVATLPIEGE